MQVDSHKYIVVVMQVDSHMFRVVMQVDSHAYLYIVQNCNAS